LSHNFSFHQPNYIWATWIMKLLVTWFYCSPSHPPSYDPILPSALPDCVLPWSNPPPTLPVNTPYYTQQTQACNH
jgi:hypothetical protein